MKTKKKQLFVALMHRKHCQENNSAFKGYTKIKIVTPLRRKPKINKMKKNKKIKNIFFGKTTKRQRQSQNNEIVTSIMGCCLNRLSCHRARGVHQLKKSDRGYEFVVFWLKVIIFHCNHFCSQHCCCCCVQFSFNNAIY